MALMDVVIYPNAPLTETAAPVVRFDDALRQFVADMFETMDDSCGVGLAAPQVGVGKQVLVLCEPEGEPMCLINPEIVEMDGKAYEEEGCLSLPDLYAPVPRATRIRVRAKDTDGNALDFEAQDFLARVIQHEYDHLQGKVFIDRLDALTRDAVLDEWEQIRARIGAGVSVAD